MGLFVTVEGIEGAGKSTLIKSLADHFRSCLLSVLTTKEPGGTILGKKIRELILQRDKSDPEIVPLAELLLFAADRAQHCGDLLRPALGSNDIVICDRYVHSTLAYQGYAAGIPLHTLKQINDIATGGLLPSLVLLLDMDPVKSLARAKKRAQENAENSDEQVNAQSSELALSKDDWNHFEKQELAFHQKIRAGFLDMAKECELNIDEHCPQCMNLRAGPTRFCVINAELSPKKVFEIAKSAIDAFLHVESKVNS